MFQLFEFLFVQNSIVIPNLSRHFIDDELHKLKISTTLKSLLSFSRGAESTRVRKRAFGEKF